MVPNWLAIEIGGTKLQVAIGSAPGSPWLAHQQAIVDPRHGAQGILQQIERMAVPLIDQYQPRGAGLGFGGPVQAEKGLAVTSHQIAGWDNFPLRDWCQNQLRLPLALANDCDAAALAEANYGAGLGAGRVFYVTVGTGVGGGFVIRGELDGTSRPAIAEIGHLRWGLDAIDPHDTVESCASGWGIAQQALRRAKAANTDGSDTATAEIMATLGQAGLPDTARLAKLAEQGNPIASQAFAHATRVLGWAIAQMITLLAPEVIVVGGGVSLAGEGLFWNPLRQQVATYVFPPLAHSYALRPAALGSEVVLHGALALATFAKVSPDNA